MKIDTLNIIVTIAGLLFVAVSLAIIILGKKVGGNQSQPQKIKIGGNIEVNTNSVLTLTIITACIAIAPLALTYWKPELSEHIHKDDVAKDYLSLKDLSIDVYGAAVVENGQFASNVDIEVVRSYMGSLDTIRTQTGEQGDFLLKLMHAKPEEEYRISWAKPGYVRKNLRFRFNAYPYPITLTKEGGS